MSFILEALKKSENERQRRVGPSLADVHRRPRPSEKPWWAIAIGALLLINLVVLLIVLLRDRGPDAPPVPASAPATVAPPAPAPAATTTVPVTAPPVPALKAQPRPQTRPTVRSLAEEAAVDPGYDAYVDPPHLAAAAAVPAGPSIVRPLQGPNVAPSPIRQAPAAAPDPEEVLPTLPELVAGGSTLPDLHLDIHVHSTVPSERFVFVNMRKYVEGQTLAEGPTIERITRDGVILNQQGLRFLLPRQ
jgi:general secretion pathway protein B